MVVGGTEEKLWLITAYAPDVTQWNTDLRTRKDGC